MGALVRFGCETVAELHAELYVGKENCVKGFEKVNSVVRKVT